MRYWWVNQRQSFAEESTGGYLWAPKVGKNGRPQHHWTAVTELAAGDVVFHYATAKIRAISRISATAIDAPRPPDLPRDIWAEDGWLVRSDYHLTQPPLQLAEIPQKLRSRVVQMGPDGRVPSFALPFTSNSRVNAGYLHPLTYSFAAQVWDLHRQRWPTSAQLEADFSPDEGPGGEWLAQRLVGEVLTTADGSTNRILEVADSHVRVATKRSPAGTLVPLSHLDRALDLLRAAGELRIYPDEIGYRSAFIGATLRTLPGVDLVRDPLRLILRAADLPETDPGPELPEGYGPDPGAPFEGDLEISVLHALRGEQAMLRRQLLAGRTHGSCALCGEYVPAGYLVAAHIKRRSDCTEDERRDLANIAMLACTFGCDALFENGAIAVDSGGQLVTHTSTFTGDLAAHVQRLDGRVCTAFRPETAGYFQWHRERTFTG